MPYDDGTRVVHLDLGVGTVLESNKTTTTVNFDKQTDYSTRVPTISLRYQTPYEEYDEMYCDKCGGTGCMC